MTLGKEQKKELLEALLSAFPSYSTLKMTIHLEHDQNMEAIVVGGTLRRHNPGNPALRRFLESVQTPEPGGGPDVLGLLQKLFPSQFDEVALYSGAPLDLLPSRMQPQAIRAIALLQYAWDQGRLVELQDLVEHVRRWT